MNKDKEQLYEIIEAYLDGKLTAEARQTFEKEMAADPELTTEVALHQRIQQELGKSAKAQLRKQLREIAQEFPAKEKGSTTIAWLRPASALLAASIIAAVIWWAWPHLSQPSWQEGPAIVVDSLPGEQTATPDSLMAIESEPEVEKVPPSVQQEQPTVAQSTADPFRPNPKLESLITDQGRDANFLVSAAAETAQMPSDSFRAIVAGTLRSGQLAEDDRIRLYIYDNKPDSYLNEQPAASLTIELEQQEDEEVLGFGKMKNYTFEKEVDRELPPGVYYYFITREGEDEPLFVGKVEVGAKD